MIKYVNGDLFKGKEDIIIHGCNCFCNMGAGVALYVKKYYPNAYKEDCKTKSGDKSKLGKYNFVECQHHFYPENKITIVNAYTQYAANESLKPFDYDAFQIFLKSFKQNKKLFEKTISTCLIGCGLGGGSWEIVSSMIEAEWKEKRSSCLLFVRGI